MGNALSSNSAWQYHSSTYRALEIKTLAQWILAGVSGSVLGLQGVGRSNLLGFLCHRPDVLATYIDPQKLQVAILSVDLDDLPTNTLNDLYRVILRAFYEARKQFVEDIQSTITRLYQNYSSVIDTFLTQSALRELIFSFQTLGYRVVLVIDRFDILCRQFTREMAQALSALRNHFRDTLSYIVGVRQSLAYLEDLEISEELYRLLTTHVCYVGILNEDDARDLINRRTKGSRIPMSEHEVETMLILTGGYPTLLKAVCRWWLLESNLLPTPQWLSMLIAAPTIHYRLQCIWAGLTQEEQMALAELQKGNLLLSESRLQMRQCYAIVLQSLKSKGICRQRSERWEVFSTLFAEYIAQVGGMSRGRIWLEQETDTLYYGQQTLFDLTPKENEILQFLVKHPMIRHSYTDVIFHVWSKDENYNGVTNDSLFQVVHGLRHKIEPNPLQPKYVVNWRGKPEGGYIFYPEGRPA